MKVLLVMLVCASLLAGVGSATPSPTPRDELAPAAPDGGSWRARPADNVCGLSDPRMLSNPAVVRFDHLLGETEEMKKMEREGIDPDSPEGVQLRDAARKRVTKACEAVRIQHAHCSVWRAIRHTGGEKPTDVTVRVRAQL